MVNSLKRLNNKQIIGLIIEVISFIGCCFNIDAFIYWFWIGEGLKMFGSMYFIDLYSKEGKTWFKKLDKKREEFNKKAIRIDILFRDSRNNNSFFGVCC